MESFFVEILPLFETPSPDARLVLFGDEAPRTEKMDVAKYLLRASRYAAVHRVYLLTSLLIHNQNYCLCFIDPRGKVVCKQTAVQLPLTRAGLAPADRLELVHTELGNFCLAVDDDILRPELARAAALKGADVLFSIQFLDPAEEEPGRLTRTVWNAAQTNNLYVVNLSCTKSCVACPAPLTRGGDGYLVRPTEALPVRFGLNLPRLDKIRHEYNLVENINMRLIERYADELGR